MTRVGFWSVMLAAFLSSGGIVGYVGQTATSADAAAGASVVRTVTVYELTAGYYIVQNGVIVPFGEQPGPGPGPAPDPTPASVTKAVLAAINAVPASDKRNATAIKLGMTYEKLGEVSLPPGKAVEAVNKIVAMSVGQKDLALLAGVCSVVDAALAKCITEAAVSDVLKEAGSACISTVPNSDAALAQMGTKLAAGETDELKLLGERYGIDWTAFMAFLMKLIIEFLPIILDLIKTAATFGQAIIFLA